MLGYVDTDNYSYLEYSNEVNIHTGGIYTNVISFSLKDNTKEFLPKFEIGSKVMYDKIPSPLD